ncbi:hydroxymethylglutaryl-CoA lyase [Planococcus sp. X10-3]|uniref:hydroxymethylglutaryl-CoA lyase n=1 Tax=Planococcus sp. X10-3 TaxID=3061240 RepID=UPI003BB08F3F
MVKQEGVWITDVTPRDGFQIEDKIVPLDIKVATINALSAAGIPEIEVTSFVHPKAVPQMADAEEVMKQIDRNPKTRYSVLVPNLRGAERAVIFKPDQLNLVVSASDTHNIQNLRRSTFETLEESKKIIKLAKDHGISTCGGIATSFGCPYEGRTPLERVLKIVEMYIDMGVDSIALADTTGMANPLQIRSVVKSVKNYWPELELSLHIHNTRGLGLANVYAGFLEGIRKFDASLGGIGGCPFAPGATGNICTEDTVHMFQEMDLDTGIDLDTLIVSAKKLEKELERQLPGQIIKAGKALELHPIPVERGQF